MTEIIALPNSVFVYTYIDTNNNLNVYFMDPKGNLYSIIDTL